MRRLWKIFRAIVSVLLLLAVILPAAIYVLLSLEPVRKAISDTASRELSNLLGAEVNVGSVRLHPFDRATVRDISLVVDGDTTAYISTVSAAFEILPLISSGDIILDYALLDGVKLAVWRDTPKTPLNIAPIIARLRSDNPGQENTFSLRINSVVIRRADATYDVRSVDRRDSLVFDPAHIAVSGLAVNADIPHISKGEVTVNLDHLSFAESSGFTLDKLSGNFSLTPSQISVCNLKIALPESEIDFKPIVLNIPDGSDLRRAPLSESIGVKTSRFDIYLPDFKAFAPVLADIDTRLHIDLDATVSAQCAH
ncbi:MAG: AsmA family protein, partial [Muribaculaceae bacterium]|nr:AsmA family protein [Muribaculaceae bacterium]